MAVADPETKKVKNGQHKQKGIGAAILFFAAALVLLGVFYYFRTDRDFSWRVINRFSTLYRAAVGSVCAKVPFSVMEVLYIAAVTFAVLFIVRTGVLMSRIPKGKIRLLLKRVFCLVIIVLYIWCAFCYTWGIDYYGDSFSEKSGLKSDGVTKEQLIYVTKLFAKGAAEWSGKVARDENGHFAEDMDTYFAASTGIYDNIEKEFNCLVGNSYMPKQMIFSDVMSRMGFTGVYFPFTGESNINVDSPSCMIPCTIAHELAHQRGVYSEQEANFLGIAASISSDDAVYKYSGYLSGLVHLMNSLYDTDKDAWREIRDTFPPEVETDWKDNNIYWDSMESGVTETAGKVYNVYLKSNGQEMGIRSYGACVDLLVAYYADK